MQQSKDKEFLDAAAELANVMLQRDLGMATDAEVEEARERALRAKLAAHDEAVHEMLASCTPVRDKGTRSGQRGPKVGTNLGDLLRAAGVAKL